MAALASCWMGCAGSLEEERVGESPRSRETILGDAALRERIMCGSDVLQSERQILAAHQVEQVEPVYASGGGGKGGTGKRLLGAKIKWLAQEGLTAQWLERVLLCHGARGAQRQLGEGVDDPFWLPDGWVEIDVEDGKGGFVVNLAGESLEQAKRIFSRAAAFARTHFIESPIAETH
jgi:hypothetical protein